jgi:hypothetical protein
MKRIKIGLLAIGVVGTLLAFTKKEKPVVKTGHSIAIWQDTIPYRHYDPSRVYVDPSTGDSIEIWIDPGTNYMMNKRNNNRITLYVDPISSDTFYGEGYVVNNMVMRMPNGKYTVDSTKIKIEGNKIKYKEGSTKGKVKITDDKIKAKDGDDKTKIKDKGDTLKVKKG